MQTLVKLGVSALVLGWTIVIMATVIIAIVIIALVIIARADVKPLLPMASIQSGKERHY